MSNTAVSTGAITTSTIKNAGSRGNVTYAEANGGTLSLAEVGGKVLMTLADGQAISLDTPVRFVDGLVATVSAGTALVHIG